MKRKRWFQGTLITLALGATVCVLAYAGTGGNAYAQDNPPAPDVNRGQDGPPPPPDVNRGHDGPPPPPDVNRGHDGPPPPPDVNRGHDGPPPPPDVNRGHDGPPPPPPGDWYGGYGPSTEGPRDGQRPGPRGGFEGPQGSERVLIWKQRQGEWGGHDGPPPPPPDDWYGGYMQQGYGYRDGQRPAARGGCDGQRGGERVLVWREPRGEWDGDRGPRRLDPDALFKRIDTNGDGVISKEEFRVFHEHQRPPRPPMGPQADDRKPGPPPGPQPDDRKPEPPLPGSPK